MRQHEENAKAVVAYLNDEDGVTDVFYPGRGGMISFRLKDEVGLIHSYNLYPNYICRKSWWCRKFNDLSSNANTC